MYGGKRDGWLGPIHEVGFNGIAVIFLAAACLKLTKNKLSAGALLRAMQLRWGPIVNLEIGTAGRDKDKDFYSGHIIHSSDCLNERIV